MPVLLDLQGRETFFAMLLDKVNKFRHPDG